ncbi:unnamed protein product [Fraxinus pennsylvanica]|uniref:Protein kinase domain-containing protein n=1 Tax=Fraxinus pennsylvanica TaxID=56036 RepID=A0AAD2DL37_9LAMI|nr:unnamed protein product [Fraxinus pennsylvanica]
MQSRHLTGPPGSRFALGQLVDLIFCIMDLFPTLFTGTSSEAIYCYIPPEYVQIMVASTKGDIYSFGVVMELITGRSPTGQADIEGGNLVGYVRWYFWFGYMKDQILHILCYYKVVHTLGQQCSR